MSVQTETYSGNLEEVFRRENMNIKKNLCASVCVNIFVLGIFLLMLQQLDVFMREYPKVCVNLQTDVR